MISSLIHLTSWVYQLTSTNIGKSSLATRVLYSTLNAVWWEFCSWLSPPKPPSSAPPKEKFNSSENKSSPETTVFPCANFILAFFFILLALCDVACMWFVSCQDPDYDCWLYLHNNVLASVTCIYHYFALNIIKEPRKISLMHGLFLPQFCYVVYDISFFQSRYIKQKYLHWCVL